MKKIPDRIEKLIICCCSEHGRIDEKNISALYASAQRAGISTELKPDLCREAAEDPESFKKMSSSGTVVASCAGRAMNALFRSKGHEVPFLADISAGPINDVLEKLGLALEECRDLDIPKIDSEWKAWYPVIDPDRCNRCAKCVDYCFFGVYKRSGGNVNVEFPRECKNNCPACARICPRQAIIFPKYPEAPINGAEGGIERKNDNAAGENIFDEKLHERLMARRRANRTTGLFREESS